MRCVYRNIRVVLYLRFSIVSWHIQSIYCIYCPRSTKRYILQSRIRVDMQTRRNILYVKTSCFHLIRVLLRNSRSASRMYLIVLGRLNDYLRVVYHHTLSTSLRSLTPSSDSNKSTIYTRPSCLLRIDIRMIK